MSYNSVNFRNYENAQLPTLYQQQTHLTKYSRWRDDLQRRETWPETVFRFWDFMANHIAVNFGYSIPENIQIEIFEGILNLEFMPSMRAMMTAGPALERDHASCYNCAYSPIDRIYTHDEGFYLSMCSCGVGFSVERQYTNQLPMLPDKLSPIDYTIIVEDDKIGWADSYRELLDLLYEGQIPSWDVSKVRKKGERLMTFGGRASGPEPLVDLFNHAVEIFRAAVDGGQRRLTSLQHHDLFTKMADVAVSGGVRRAATISLSNPSDERMRDAKTGEWWNRNPHFRLANNSAIWTDNPSSTQFLDEWLALVRSQAGERGQINRAALIRQARRVRRIDVDKWGEHYGLNPCFAADTLIVTDAGAYPIESLVGQTVRIWNGIGWQEIDNFRETGRHQPMLKLTLYDGSSLRVTPYHKMIREDGSRCEARELQIGDRLELSEIQYDGNIEEKGAYLKGFLLGDGTLFNKPDPNPGLFLYEPKFCCRDHLVASALEIEPSNIRTNAISEPGFTDGDCRLTMTGLSVRSYELLNWCGYYRAGLPSYVHQWDRKSKVEFLTGLFDADGNSMDSKNGFGYQLTSISRGLLGDVQIILKSFGIRSKVSLMKKGGVSFDLPGKREGYLTQDCWRLTISQAASIALSSEVTFSRLKSFAMRETKYDVKSKSNKIISIEDDGIDDRVFCCTVPVHHKLALAVGFMTGQCGEIILRPRQFCNLTTNIIRADDGLRDLLRKIRLSTIVGTLQSTLTNFRYLSSEWRFNCEEERLLGVSLNGIFDNRFTAGLDYIRNGSHLSDDFVIDGVKVELPGVLAAMRDTAVAVNADWADRLGVNPSAAITTVKPEGNNSNLVDCRSGLHGAHATHFYIRTNRANKVDKLGQFMITQGVVAEDDAASPDTAWVLYFPMTVPEGAISRHDYSAIEHLKIWKLYQENYCEHKPSITISVKDREWMSVGAWVYENFDMVSGIAFLPWAGGNYRQAPYIECTKKQFDDLVARTPTDIDWSQFHEDSDYTEQAKTLACVGGVCEI